MRCSKAISMIPVAVLFLISALTGILLGQPVQAGSADCRPTPSEPMGPFYESDAPVRSKVGEGYILTGTVKSTKDCTPIGGARIELWLTGPDGHYDDAHRATVIADGDGTYRFESNRPQGYSFRPPHIHIRVTAQGYRTLVTQHYPKEGQTRGSFDLVLVPQSQGQ